MRYLHRIPFAGQMVLALGLTLLSGKFLPGGDPLYALLGKLFLNAISMTISPLIFSVVIVAVVNIYRQAAFGTIMMKTFIYFFAVTTLIIAIFLLGGYYLHFGQGLSLLGGQAASLSQLQDSINLWDFVGNIIPANLFQAFNDNQILSVLFVAIALGIAIGQYGPERAEPLMDIFNIISVVFFKLTDLIITLSPLGVYGIVAHNVKLIGLDSLGMLAQYVLGLYIAYLILAFVIFPIITAVFRINGLTLVRAIKDLLLLAFVTGSSNVVLSKLLERFKKMHTSEQISDFVLPLGYTFNLDGAAVYLSITVAFMLNAYDLSLTIGTLFSLIIMLTLISKTIATVPSGAFIVLLAVSSQLGIPKEGLAFLFAIDLIPNAGRTALNVLGNAIAGQVLNQNRKG